MSLYTSISTEKLSRLGRTANAPTLIDVRIDDDFAAAPRLIPGATRRSHRDVHDWASNLTGQSLVVICRKGEKPSEGTAALLLYNSIAADRLEGGQVGWKKAEIPTVCADKVPRRDERGRALCVMRSRPKINRIACSWLIRRFIDPSAVFPSSLRPKSLRSLSDSMPRRSENETTRLHWSVDSRIDSTFNVQDCLIFNAVKGGHAYTASGPRGLPPWPLQGCDDRHHVPHRCDQEPPWSRNAGRPSGSQSRIPFRFE
jgi:rhodanese-related sulfurtransferase